MEIFKQGELVTIHSLGDGLEYRGEINGCAFLPLDDMPGFWIVKWIDAYQGFDNGYSHAVIIGSCIRKMEKK